ncbi:MAG: hypothetical protein LBU58_11845 [Clostridiales bacterium]|jgi:DNA-binding SARP family transcriptional activator|nr:hypothetical protein [Clostridiales bacterium]
MANRKAAGKNTGGDLKIYTFGGFRLERDGKNVSSAAGRSKKMWDLFKFIITMRDNKLSVMDCYEAVWGEEENGSNPTAALHNLVYRLRRVIENATQDSEGSAQERSYIRFADGSYFLNRDAGYWLDAEVFEKKVAEARTISAFDPEHAIMLYKEAMEFYKGEYLPEYIYNSWVLATRNKYSRLFFEGGVELATLLRNAERYQEILDLCERVFSLEAMDDQFHAIFIDALIDMGKIMQAQSHYQYVTAMLYREMGIKPTAVLKRSYDRIKKSGGLSHADLAQVQARLNETTGSKGAFYCELDIFRSIYRLESRRMPRNGRSQFLCLATLSSDSDLALETQEAKQEIDTLIRVTVSTLRAGDLVSRWSEDQLIMLLPSITVEDNQKVMRRLEHKFRETKQNQRVRVRLEYTSLMDLE